MTTRRDHRQTHVRPRPPSTGRPAPVKVKPRSPGPTRLVQPPADPAQPRPADRLPARPRRRRRRPRRRRPVRRRRRVRDASPAASARRSAASSTSVTSTPSPRAVVAVVCRPALARAAQPSPTRSEATADLVGHRPGRRSTATRTTGSGSTSTLPDQAPTADPGGRRSPTAPKTIIPVELTKGINDFTVTIVGPGGESDPSRGRPLRVRRGAAEDHRSPRPRTTPSSTARRSTIKGKTQARTTLLARNDANGSSIAGTAGADGTFTLSLALARGVNKITITGTDPAGNVADDDLNVRRGLGQADRAADRVRLPDQALAGCPSR